MAPPKPGSPVPRSGSGSNEDPPEAWLPTKAHDRRSTRPASLRMAPPHTWAGQEGDVGVGVCAVLPAKEQLLPFTVPPRLKMAPPLACGLRSSSPTQMVAVFEQNVTPVRFTAPPRFRMAEPPGLWPFMTVKLTMVKLTLV